MPLGLRGPQSQPESKWGVSFFAWTVHHQNDDSVCRQSSRK